jgi:crotonobetainyl-CoA:carnitine CoA-transferase CaiB-like acyl-CoA transferase
MAALPLEGLRVLDLTRLLPGPAATLLLADLGADVVKVEDVGAGDYLRWTPPHYHGGDATASSAAFLALNRNKRSIRIDLKTEAGADALRRLARDADVLIESFRPGVLDALGVGYERLRQEHPGLVYCAISGYGQDGPGRDRAGHDLNYVGVTGLLALTGERGGPPVPSAGQIADFGAGATMAAFGILAALRERDRSGQGQLVDVSMTDGALSWLAVPAAQHLAGDPVPERGAFALAGGLACYRPYRCADGGWVTLGALERKFWDVLCRGVGREDLLDRHLDPVGSATHRALEELFASRTRHEWTAFADEHDCCLAPVLELDEALEAPLFRERGMVVEAPRAGSDEPVRQLGSPIRLSATPAQPARRAAPGRGEHTGEVLRAAGYSDEELRRLEDDGAIAGPARGPRGSFLAERPR